MSAPSQSDPGSPKPHHWTIWLTLAAIVVSVVGLVINRNVYELNRETAGSAAVLVTSMNLRSATKLETREGAHFIEPIRLDMTFKSAGKLVAQAVTVVATAESFFQKRIANGGVDTSVLPSREVLLMDARDMSPGRPSSIEGDIELAPSPLGLIENSADLQRLIKIQIHLRVSYDDAMGSHRDDFCFESLADHSGATAPGELKDCSHPGEIATAFGV
jgi:hypothetical protein